MANVFFNLPVPPSEGFGDPVDVSRTNRFKTFIMTGNSGNAVFAIEASHNGDSWDTLTVLSGPPPGAQTVQGICRFVRVARRRGGGSTPVITLGATEDSVGGGGGGGVTDLHVVGNPGISGSVELTAGPNIVLSQTGSQIQIEAAAQQATGEQAIFLTYPDTESVIDGAQTTNEVLINQHLVSYGAMLPAGPIRGFFRGLYSLNGGGLTIRVRRDPAVSIDTIEGMEIGQATPAGTGGSFRAFGIDVTDENQGGISLIKITAQVDGPGTMVRIKSGTNKLVGAGLR